MVKKKRQSDVQVDGSTTDSSEDGLHNSAYSDSACQHAKKSVDLSKLRKVIKAGGVATDCLQCCKQGATTHAIEAKESTLNEPFGFEYDNTLWLCLKCGSQLCGRSKNQHALQHYKTPHSDSHALTINTRTLEIWCYDCDNEVKANSRKNLMECIEIIKKATVKPIPIGSPTRSTPLDNLEWEITSAYESLPPANSQSKEVGTVNNKTIPLPPIPPIPGMAKRITDTTFADNSASMPLLMSVNVSSADEKSLIETLPRVRGLTNLGNTCFFNAVMQCLAQTPYLLDVLKELSEAGEEFTLPGGTFKFKDDEDVQLPAIKGTLSSGGSLTTSLAQALEELQSGGGVFTPSKLFDKLCTKCPQFRGGDQHDSHELLRHLLESVRSEDLKRYQRVILTNLGYKDQDINNVSEDMRQKCKIYGNQAADRILRPEQVFRGFLVSTLTCQDCFNVSSRHEYFLDMSLPVSIEKPQPPIRRKPSNDNTADAPSFYLCAPSAVPSKMQIKKEKERGAKRTAKYHEIKLKQKAVPENTTNISRGVAASKTNSEIEGVKLEDESYYASSSSEQSDADVEDNILDDNAALKRTQNSIATSYDTNGNYKMFNSSNPEKRDDLPENMDKDSLDEDENDSGIANSPANVCSNYLPSSEKNGGVLSSGANSAAIANNSLIEVGLSEKGATMMRQLSLNDTVAASNAGDGIVNGDCKEEEAIFVQLEKLQLSEKKESRIKAKRVRTQSHSDWSTTIGPRYQCEDGECSVQSCLNNFTAVELMTGNNKVGCENCTNRKRVTDSNAKTVYTNATKQFLISSPPAVLILHLKRFQLGPRCIFRKLTRAVNFPMVLDIAPFCGSKVKNLPNIDRKQKKLLYALYGIVEHSGGMYGGHYTAYVKVRPKLSRVHKRWKFLPQGSKAELEQDDEQRKKLEELLAKEKARELRMKAANDSDDFSNCTDCSSAAFSSGPDEAPDEGACGGDDEARDVQVPIGKWYYVSDSRVQEVNEEAVLRAQAYLLFYERIY